MTETGAEIEAWRCLAVVVPIIFLFTPIGGFLSSHAHLIARTFVFFTLSSLSLVSLLRFYTSQTSINLRIIPGSWIKCNTFDSGPRPNGWRNHYDNPCRFLSSFILF